jgi:hypothetical protein
MNAAIEDGDVDTAEILLLDAPTFFTFLRA